ncbi:F-box/FBD/LRR-repeat protein, partial [Mucuna pruriens]
MAEPPERKALKGTSQSDNNTDRLSTLSDCVLLQILSHLDTKEAAVTANLSTRWRHLFLSLPEINLCFTVNDNASYSVSDSERDSLFHLFTQFGNRVLQQRNKAPIRKIRLYVKHFVEGFRPGFESLLMSTAAAVSSYKIESLQVFVDMDKTLTEPCPVTVPPGLFSSETLVALHLSLRVSWNVPELVWLPNLKHLHLISFRLADEDSIQRLLQGCPSLENLVLILRNLNESEGEESGEVETLHVSSPSLKCVMLFWDERVESEFNVVVKSESLESLICSLEGRHRVTVDAPNLKSLTITGNVFEVHVSQSLISINEAVIEAGFLFKVADVDELFLRAHHALTFFGGLQHVKSLSLSENIMKVLYFSPSVMPTFRNLIKLKLIPDYCHYFPRNGILQVLLNLFESSPNLEVLIFSEINCYAFCSPLYTLYEHLYEQVFENYFGEDDEFNSVLLRALPLSFVEHLKVIEMNNFKGGELEFKLVEYFLMNGKSLEKIALEREGWKSVPKHCNRILSFKKCSEDCQIVFRKKWDFIKCPQLRQAMNLSP